MSTVEDAPHATPSPTNAIAGRIEDLSGQLVDHVEEIVHDVAAVLRPRLRGWLHAAAAPAALALGAWLYLRATPGDSRLGVIAFILTAVWLFAVSSVYNIGGGRFAPGTEAVLKRVDHASIFVLIAGSYTAFALVLLHGHDRVALLSLAWSVCGAGVLFRVLAPNAPRWVYTPIYLGAGWMSVFFLPAFAAAATTTVVALMVSGGVLYSIGAVVYGLRKPNPWPRIFGFHEVFHAFTILAFLAHFGCISLACTS